jgi:hypothetical protein
MIPDYARGRESAIRILKLNNRQSKIDPQNGAGVIFVSIQKSIIFEIYLLNFCI